MNNKIILKAILIILIMPVFGCAKTDSEIVQQRITEEMEWLYKADPIDDVEVALNKKDYRFLGIYGAKLITPGVDIDCLDSKKDINPIKGTSDAVIGYEHAKLISIASTYAQYYNFNMWVHLKEEGLFKCSS